ncbi:MAG: IS630 family transposase [Anaerolineae bacterium]|nr:IS630 family transposase [Anaerolineae bacterium]MCO5205849.1 IS630 family transposase [Anaerolineae bacterium]
MDIAQFAPETVILAEDEASLYLQATTTAVWAPLGQTPTVRAHPGRDKVNFYGTLNLHSGQTVATRAEKMNSTATALHLEHVLSAYPDVPILLLWDRAPWHGGAAVRAVLQANSRLELMRFPTASPDLNPQEMVWKATRTAVSHNHDVHQMQTLADRFEDHLVSNRFCYSMLEKYDHDRLCAMFN